MAQNIRNFFIWGLLFAALPMVAYADPVMTIRQGREERSPYEEIANVLTTKTLHQNSGFDFTWRESSGLGVTERYKKY